MLIDDNAISALKGQNTSDIKRKYIEKFNNSYEGINHLYLAYIGDNNILSYVYNLLNLSKSSANDTLIIAPKISKNETEYNMYTERLSQEEFREITYISENPIGITGDQSFIDALLLGKVCYYETPSWKENMIEKLVELLRDKYKYYKLANWYQWKSIKEDTEEKEEEKEEDKEGTMAELETEAKNFAEKLKTDNAETYKKILDQILLVIKPPSKEGGFNRKRSKKKQKEKQKKQKEKQKTN